MQKYSYLLHQICDVKDSNYIKVSSVIALYLIITKMNGYSENINGNKCSTLVSTNKSKEIIKYMKNYGVKSEI